MKHSGFNTVVVYTFVLLLLSCSNRTNYLDQSLRQAGNNRSELEQVLEHYADNPEKLAAARFLIENMPAHYSYADSSAIHEYYSIALNVLQSDLSPVAQRDSLYNLTNSRFYGLEYNTISDVKIIKSDFLIKSIDQSGKNALGLHILLSMNSVNGYYPTKQWNCKNMTIGVILCPHTSHGD